MKLLIFKKLFVLDLHITFESKNIIKNSKQRSVLGLRTTFE